MPNTSRDYERELSLIMNAIAESVAETPAETLLAECQEAGVDAETVTNPVRKVLEKALRDFRQQKLREARKEYESRAAAIQSQPPLSGSIAQLKEWLVSFFDMNPQFRGLVTAQYRDLEELSENDVRRILGQLQQLGAFNVPSQDNDR